MKKLILFIHGIGGSAKGTWEKFPELMGKDADLTSQYDVKTFEYPTGIVGSKPGLKSIAAILKTEIENRYPASAYSDIALIAHSQGGLVARFYIAERIISAQPLRVSRLLTFATPHQGSGSATLPSPANSPRTWTLTRISCGISASRGDRRRPTCASSPDMSWRRATPSSGK